MKCLKDNLVDIQIAKGPGIPTGFPQLDEMTNGLEKGEVVLIAGRSSMGKTAIVIDVALNASQNNNVGIFSLEMGAVSLVTRMIANKQNVSFKSLVRGEVQPDEKVKEILSSLRLWIDDRAGITSNDILDTVSTFIKTNSLDVVLIDYLQLVRPPTAKRQRYEEVDKIVEHLRNIAKHFNIAMVITAQLNREVERRDKHEPRLSDLRESGGIEQVCDKILLLYRPSYYSIYEQNKKAEEAGVDDSEAYIIVAKNRNGETGRVPLVWLGNCMSYRPVNFSLETEF